MATGPIDYLGAMPQQDFLRDIQGGLQLGGAYRQQQQAIQQQELAKQAQAQYQADIAQAFTKADPQSFAALSLKYPQQREAIKQSWDQLSEGDRKTEGDTMSQAYSALLSDRPDIAQAAIQKTRDARQNAGLDTSHYDAALEMVKADPQKAKGTLGFTLSHINNPKDFAATFGALQKNGREQDVQPANFRLANAKADGETADAVQKNQAIVGSTLGALEGKNAKVSQVENALMSLSKRGIINQDELVGYLHDIPTDAKDRNAWLGSIRMAGLKPDDQAELVTPDANSRLSSDTQLRTTAMNVQGQKDVQRMIGDRQAAAREVAVSHGVKGLTPEQNEALFGENGAVTLGRLDPNKINGKTASIYADAAIKNPNIDFAKLSSSVNATRKTDADFTTGKNGNAVRSFNVGLSHLDTLDQLATALQNKDTQLFNRVGNYYATQTGDPAPTSFNAAKKIVGDEIVKAIVGAGGGVSDREEVAKTISAANSPAQLKSVIKTYKELMVGQLGGLERQYTVSTGRQDFDKFLSPEAVKVRGDHSPKAAAPALPSGWSVKEH